MDMKTAAETKPLPKIASLEELIKLGTRKMNVPGNFRAYEEGSLRVLVIWRGTGNWNYELFHVFPHGYD